MYERITHTFRDSVEIEEHHTARYGAQGEKRQKRKKPTQEQIQRNNQRNRLKRIRRMAKWNWQEGDPFLTLTYARGRRPETIQEARKQVTEFLRKLRRAYKKQGTPLKYLYLIEQGSKGGIHCHMLINRIRDYDMLVSKYWPYGGTHPEPVRDEESLEKVASYLAKTPEDDNRMKQYIWSHSRGLVEHKPKKEIMRRSTFRDAPQIPRGFYLDKSSYWEGKNPLGFQARHYILRRIRGEDVQRVDINVIVDAKQGKFRYAMKYKKKNGELLIVEEDGTAKGTRRELLLLAAVRAMERINRKCTVYVHLGDRWIANMAENYLPQWAKAEFKKNDGKPVSMERAWRRLWKEIRTHDVHID